MPGDLVALPDLAELPGLADLPAQYWPAPGVPAAALQRRLAAARRVGHLK
jgi:hypothetical protein